MTRVIAGNIGGHGLRVLDSLPHEARVSTRAECRALRVLVVEDELLIRWSITETLTAAGHIVTEASDATSARRVLQEAVEPIDVVFLDLRLPDSDDLTLLQDIRRLSPRTAVVMMTAYGTPDAYSGALQLGAYAVMNKPFEIADLDPLARQAHLAIN